VPVEANRQVRHAAAAALPVVMDSSGHAAEAALHAEAALRAELASAAGSLDVACGVLAQDAHQGGQAAERKVLTAVDTHLVVRHPKHAAVLAHPSIEGLLDELLDELEE